MTKPKNALGTGLGGSFPTWDERTIDGRHVIEDISYSKDWLLCECGWEGVAWDLRDFAEHRKSVGAVRLKKHG